VSSQVKSSQVQSNEVNTNPSPNLGLMLLLTQIKLLYTVNTTPA